MCSYDIEEREDGWAVVNVETRGIASVNGVLQAGMEIQDADELADCLNYIEANRPLKAH